MCQDIGNVSFHSNTMAKHIMAAQGLETDAITGDLGAEHMVLRVYWSGDIATGFVPFMTNVGSFN